MLWFFCCRCVCRKSSAYYSVSKVDEINKSHSQKIQAEIEMSIYFTINPRLNVMLCILLWKHCGFSTLTVFFSYLHNPYQNPPWQICIKIFMIWVDLPLCIFCCKEISSISIPCGPTPTIFHFYFFAVYRKLLARQRPKDTFLTSIRLLNTFSMYVRSFPVYILNNV